MTRLGGAGEASGLMTEQLGLDQVFRKRCAVHNDQRPGPARGQMVQALGDQLLARPALTNHKDGPVERRSTARPLDRVEEGKALPDKLVRPLHVPSLQNLPDCWWQIPPIGKDFR